MQHTQRLPVAAHGMFATHGQQLPSIGRNHGRLMPACGVLHINCLLAL